jgi:AraC-like DNA-binding protein
MCGFCDSYHYSKTFKKYYHQTPAQYRKEFLR